MLHKSLRFFCGAVILCAGCAHKAAIYQRTNSVDSAAEREGYLYAFGRSGILLSSGPAGGGGGTVFAAPRFVALRHRLEIVEPSSGLAKSIEAVVAFCGTIQCEVLSSSVTNETAVLSPLGEHRRSRRTSRPKQIPRFRWEAGKNCAALHGIGRQDRCGR